MISWVGQHWKQVDFCFANAGKAEFGPFDRQDWKTMEELFQLNVFSPIQLGLDLKKSFAGPHFRHIITCSAIAPTVRPKLLYCVGPKRSGRNEMGTGLVLHFPLLQILLFLRKQGKKFQKHFQFNLPLGLLK